MASRCRCHSARLLVSVALLLVTLTLLLPYLRPPLSQRNFLAHDEPQRQRNNSEDEQLDALEILMPGAAPFKAGANASSGSSQDVYLCTSLRLPNDNATLYLARFEPLLGASGLGPLLHVHHMLLAACDRLPRGVATGGDRARWNCGTMAATGESPPAETPPMEMCASGLRYIYAYAMEAPALRLPAGVAFPVSGGGRSHGWRHLVLQVHYTSLSSSAGPTRLHRHHGSNMTGLRLGLRRSAPQRLAGVHLTATGGLIPPRSVAHLSAGCPYTGDAALRPFAFRVHTHRLGRVVSVYRVRRRAGSHGNSVGGGMEWSLIGRANPQLAQMFYPVNGSGVDLLSGDCVAAVCVMENLADHLVRIGPTFDDEMCNAYVMYWYRSEDSNKFMDYGCSSKGYSDLWVEAPASVVRESASVPGTDRFLPHTAGY